MPLGTCRLLSPPLALALLAAAIATGCSGKIDAGDDGAGGEPGAVSVVVDPSSAIVAPLATAAFTAAVAGSANTSVVWSAPDAGTIDGAGLYTAPATTGSFRVVATSAADPTKRAQAVVTVTPGGAVTGLREQLEVLATKRIYFGHQSVGGQILGPPLWTAFTPSATYGVAKLIEDHPGVGLSIKQLDDSFPGAFTVGTFANSKIGQNWAVMTKITGTGGEEPSFDAIVRSGRVPNADIAFMKLGYTDFTETTDVEAVFAQYVATLTALERDFPATLFAHVTPPLTRGADASQCDRNGVRLAFGRRLIETYGARVFDLAAAQATNANGTAAVCVGSGGARHAALSDDWDFPDDLSHLDQAGADMLAPKLVEFLANVH